MKYLGVAGVAILAVAMVGLTWMNYQSPTLSVSLHIALHAWSMMVFGVIGTVAAVLLTLYLLLYLPGQRPLSWVYRALAAIVSTGLFLLCWFPAVPGLSMTIHQVATWSILYLAIALVTDLLFELRQVRAPWLLVASGVYFAVLLSTLSIKLFLHEFYTSWILYLEIAYTLTIFGVIASSVTTVKISQNNE